MDNLTYLIAHAPTAPDWFRTAGYDEEPVYERLTELGKTPEEADQIVDHYYFQKDIEWRIYWARSVLLQLEGEGIREAKKDDPEGEVLYRVMVKRESGWAAWSTPFLSSADAQECFETACMTNPQNEFKIAAEEVSDE